MTGEGGFGMASFPPAALGRFCEQVLADVSLQEKLRQPDDADQFIALAVATARDCGLPLGPEDVRSAMRGRLPGMGELAESRTSETPLPPKGWLPIGTSWQQAELYVQWAYFGEQRLREPFFEGSVQRRLFKPFNRLFRYSTPVAKLAGWLQAHPSLRPAGFIFHMSRCGSTLVSQMLAALAQNVVISEASPIDAVVRARHVRPDLSNEQHDLWLAWMIGALGQPRSGDERRYFIKLDCWHTLALPLFRRAFPEVPWVFMYRDPVEVLVSQLRMPGLQMIQGALGPDLFGITPSDGWLKPEDYCARVLARICEPVLQHYAGGAAMLVNYHQLPQALWTTIMPHFGVQCSDGDRIAMSAAARYDAKTPTFEFTPDVHGKQQEATAAVRTIADQRLGELYRRLEALRLG
ncbi:MAG: hypothetical protein QOI12_1557 [Alphaproteobacteria bacterium]|jgi:hypothetical protein|nr:hypothetical protein [Alphaproteobacteria bacterium]